MPRVGIALGSNLGDRLANLQAARDLLASISDDGPLLQAPIFQTSPVDCPDDSPDFYNTVVEIGYAGTPAQLLEITQDFQRNLGRQTVHQRNAPRIIDIDLLYFGEEIIATDSLELPHPRLTQRRFVLQPLAAIQPKLVLSGDSQDISSHLKNITSKEPPLIDAHSIW